MKDSVSIQSRGENDVFLLVILLAFLMENGGIGRVSRSTVDAAMALYTTTLGKVEIELDPEQDLILRIQT